MSYYTLLEYVEKYNFTNSLSVVVFLIGLKGYVNATDYENICMLLKEGVLDE